jgi:uncharacterized protein YaiL (DUF2058 family)
MTEQVAKPQAETATDTVLDSADKTQAQAQTVTVDDLQGQIDAMQKALKKANKEAEDRRIKLEAIDKEKAEAEKAKLSEADKLKLAKDEAEQKAKDAIAKANERLIKAEVKANSLNFIDADAAYALVDKSMITVDDNGDVQGVSEALAKLATEKPGLLKSKTNPNLPATNPNATNNAAPTAAARRDFLYGNGPLPQ